MRSMSLIKLIILVVLLVLVSVIGAYCQDTNTISGHVYPMDAPSNTIIHRQAVRVVVYEIDNGYTSYVGTVAVQGSGYYQVTLPSGRLYVVVPSLPRKALSRYLNAVAIFDNNPAYIFENLSEDHPDSNFELTILQFAITRDGV